MLKQDWKSLQPLERMIVRLIVFVTVVLGPAIVVCDYMEHHR